MLTVEVLVPLSVKAVEVVFDASMNDCVHPAIAGEYA
jgi:hypothetical protein